MEDFICDIINFIGMVVYTILVFAPVFCILHLLGAIHLDGCSCEKCMHSHLNSCSCEKCMPRAIKEYCPCGCGEYEIIYN